MVFGRLPKVTAQRVDSAPEPAYRFELAAPIADMPSGPVKAASIIGLRWKGLGSNLAIGAATGFALTTATIALVFDHTRPLPSMPAVIQDLGLRGTIAPVDKVPFRRPDEVTRKRTSRFA